VVSVRCFASFWWSFRSCKVLPSFSFQILPVFRCLVRSLCPDVSPAGLRVKSAGCLPRRARPCFCFEPPASLAWPVRSPCLGTRPRALLLTKDLTDASSSQLGTYDVAVSDAGPSRYIPCPDLPDHSHHGWTFAGRLPIPPPSRSSLSTNHGHLPPRSTQNRCFLTGPAFEGIQPPLSALKKSYSSPIRTKQSVIHTRPKPRRTTTNGMASRDARPAGRRYLRYLHAIFAGPNLRHASTWHRCRRPRSNLASPSWTLDMRRQRC